MSFSFSFDPQDYVAYACLWSLVHPLEEKLLESVLENILYTDQEKPALEKAGYIFQEAIFYRALRRSLLHSYKVGVHTSSSSHEEPSDYIKTAIEDFCVMFGKLFYTRLKNESFNQFMETLLIDHMLDFSTETFFKMHDVNSGDFLACLSRIYPATFCRISLLADKNTKASLEEFLRLITRTHN